MQLRTCSIFLILFLVLQINVFAQEEEEPEDEPPYIDSEWSDYEPSVYGPGDKTFSMTLGIIFPLFFSGDVVGDSKIGLNLGGTGTLAFNYFLTSNIFIGGELSGMFAGTRGKNMLFIIPFGLRIGYQFVFNRFEFPLSLMVGAANQIHSDNRYFGFILKPGASVFWRFNPDWSFGLNGVWWIIPQRPKDEYEANSTGNLMELTLSARYHF
jgi:hypothetical protein